MKHCTVVFVLIIVFTICNQGNCLPKGNDVEQFTISVEENPKENGKDESWGYVTVRPKAHMFYWLYPTTHPEGCEKRPLILWLQGGPGGSSTGFGNFEEIGPLDVELKPRNFPWLQTASLLFVDNPVGTGFSYVDELSALTTNLKEITDDLLVFIKNFLDKNPTYKSTPFYIMAESYGGKMAAGFSYVLHEAIQKGEVEMNFKGVGLGDSWISPVSYTNSWGPYLYATSIISYSGLMKLQKGAEKISNLTKEGKWEEATSAWNDLEDMVEDVGGGVNFYNILDWQNAEPSLKRKAKTYTESLYNRHVKVMENDPLSDLMNGEIRDKLAIIPDDVKWGGQSDQVFEAQSGDFMKDVISTVNALVNSTKLKVVVFNGQLDLICDTLGTENWFYTLDAAEEFKKAERMSYTCKTADSTCFFGQQLENLHFYWIMKAGHMVPADNGPAALALVERVIE